jgi:hypothetical protein
VFIRSIKALPNSRATEYFSTVPFLTKGTSFFHYSIMGINMHFKKMERMINQESIIFNGYFKKNQIKFNNMGR